jgi:hypothetical protein
VPFDVLVEQRLGLLEVSREEGVVAAQDELDVLLAHADETNPRAIKSDAAATTTRSRAPSSTPR